MSSHGGPDEGLLHTTVYAIRRTEGDGSGRHGRRRAGGSLADGRFVSVPDDPAGVGVDENAIFEDLEGSLWIGTGGGGLHRIEGHSAAADLLDARAMSFGVAEGLSNGIVYSIDQDREGSLWIGTGGGGLNRLRRGSFAALTTREGLSHDQTSVVYEDRAGVLWSGTWGGGLNRFQGSTRRIFGSSSGLSGDVVSSLYEDRRGDLWIGTYGAGLNRMRNGRITVYDSTKGLANDTVWGMAEDREGALWIGTSGGLSRLEDGAFTTYTARDGPRTRW